MVFSKIDEDTSIVDTLQRVDVSFLNSSNATKAFPVDVWIKRIMETMYFGGVDTPKDKIAAFAKEQFGELGGFAQQYLFYYGKSIKMGVK